MAAGTGIITTVAGNGAETPSDDGDAATAAGPSCPSGVFVVTSATDPASGTLFIADARGHQARSRGPAAPPRRRRN